MPALRLSFLGNVRLAGPDGCEFRLPTRKALFLLALLAAAPDRKVSRDRAINLLWSSRKEAQARASLRQTVFLLHRCLPNGSNSALVADRDTLSLSPDIVWVDVWALRDALCAGSSEELARAATLYSGEFLEGLIPPDPAFDEWLTEARTGLRDEIVRLLERLVELQSTASNRSGAVRAAERLVQIDPLREASQRVLIRALAGAGDTAEAMRRYLQARDLLRRELGVGLSEQTEALYEALGGNGTNLSGGVVVPLPQSRSGRITTARETEDFQQPLQAPIVVVLPFDNLSQDPEQIYFSDGLTEDLIIALTSWRLFPVIAWSSSVAYRGGGADDIRRIGRELGARFLLRGTVRKSDRLVRITARCIDTASGLQVWAERYDRVLADVFHVQDEIAAKIAALVVPEMELTELKRSAARRTSDMTAWDYLLRGRALLRTYTCKDNAEARSLFKRAIELDPQYCDAWTGLAYSHLRDIDIGCAEPRSLMSASCILEDACLPDIDIGCAEPRETALAQAFAAARQAVRLDAASSAARLCLGQAFIWAEDYGSGIAETEEAVRLNPCNAHARMALGNRWDLAGRSREGIAEMESSLKLNPLDPNRFACMGYLSRAYLRLGEAETALAWARRMVELKPDYPDAHFRLAACLAQLDRRDEGCLALERSETLHPGFVELRSAWHPYPDPASNERFFAGLKRHRLLPT